VLVVRIRVLGPLAIKIEGIPAELRRPSRPERLARRFREAQTVPERSVLMLVSATTKRGDHPMSIATLEPTTVRPVPASLTAAADPR
jgi:hypothetical protein